MKKLLLVIGNKNYSSWSLRAWLVLTESGIAFDEIRISLCTWGFRDAIPPAQPGREGPDARGRGRGHLGHTGVKP